MLVTLDEVKIYLRLDGNNEDSLIESLIQTAQNLCEDIIRKKVTDFQTVPEVFKIAILYSVAFLYENREQADCGELIKTLCSLLFGLRNEVF